MLNINENVNDEFIVINLNHDSNNSNSNENNNNTLKEHNNNHIITQQPTNIHNTDNQSINILPKANKKNSITHDFINLMKLCFDI